MDDIMPTQRRRCMSRIRSRDTKIETDLRKLLWEKGVRGYRVCNTKIFGRPDLYFPRKKIAIFIDGCFWHNCPKCNLKPKSNIGYWSLKFDRNRSRDFIVNCELIAQGIIVVRIWEHELKTDKNIIYHRIVRLLS